jgi:N utilization substance protein A
MAQDNKILQAMKQICEEKNIPFESVVETIEAALAVAYRKDFGEKNNNIKVEFDPKTTKSRFFDIKTVVEDDKAVKTEEMKQKIMDKKEKGEEITEEEAQFERFNPKTEITLSEAKKIKKDAKLEEVITTELFPKEDYGRMAAQTAKQVIIQKLREAERGAIYKEYKDKVGEILNATIQRLEGRMMLVDIGHTTAIMPPAEQVRQERYSPGQRVKIYLVAVNETPKGPEIIVSRAHPEMVKKLFYLEVPEIASGAVEIKAVAREAGSRTKIAVATNQKNIDPVGSCVGQRGSRVQTIISELGGEKIDIVEWDDDPVKFISNALSPAKVLSVKLNEQDKTAIAEVKEDQLSLAIGKGGQNVRLSARLTGWKIDIVGEGQKTRQAPKVEEGKPEEPAEEKKEGKVEVKEEKKEEAKEEKKEEPAKEEKPATETDEAKKAVKAPKEAKKAGEKKAKAKKEKASEKTEVKAKEEKSENK